MVIAIEMMWPWQCAMSQGSQMIKDSTYGLGEKIFSLNDESNLDLSDNL